MPGSERNEKCLIRCNIYRVGRTGLELVTDGLARDYSPGLRVRRSSSTYLDMIGDFSPILYLCIPDYSG